MATNIDLGIWQPLSVTSEHRIEILDRPYGKWMISQGRRSENNGARLSFQRAMPEGWTVDTYVAEMKRLKALSEEWTVEKSRVLSYVSRTEIGYGQSFEETLLLVNYLENKSGYAPAEQILLANDFEFQHEFDNHRGHFRIFRHKVKANLTVDLSDVDISVRYDMNNGWENLVRVAGYLEWDDGTHVPNGITEVIDDYQAAVVAFLIDIMQRRIARGGWFKKPLVLI